MAKLLLVEDDISLRDIYSARFTNEGYEVITASDGEEALATAVRERPDLIILDVMMPKISGFDVLDILRSTPETKDTKVIMMTALSQESDKTRGESLGANRYLIKSQLTLEDVVNTAREVLAGDNPTSPVAGQTAAAASTPAPVTPASGTPPPASTSTPAAPVDTPAPAAPPAAASDSQPTPPPPAAGQ